MTSTTGVRTSRPAWLPLIDERDPPTDKQIYEDECRRYPALEVITLSAVPSGQVARKYMPSMYDLCWQGFLDLNGVLGFNHLPSESIQIQPTPRPDCAERPIS